MRELVDWLTGLEKSAADTYAKAAKRFSDDTELASFLTQLSRDEITHHGAMRLAQAYLNKVEHCPAVIDFDEESRWDIEAPFIELNTALDRGITKAELMSYVVLIEYSELNELFLYVANVVRERSSGSVNITVDIDRHKERIEKFICRYPELTDLMDRVTGLPKSSGDRRKILIVDDVANNLFLMKALFSDKFTVDTAKNGVEAYGKVRAGYYSAIISDVKMPLMNGIEFYKKARAISPGIDSRFIFYTGSMDVEHEMFFKVNRLKYLTKPSPAGMVRKTVAGVLC